jgi:hypothetical protein
MSEQSLLERMLQLISQKQGVISATQLQAGGITPQDLHLLLDEHVLREETPDRYVLAEPLVDIDALVLAHWAVPQGVFGGLTALVYHALSVAQLVAFDVFVPDGVVVPPIVADMPLRRHVLSHDLLSFGVAPLTPSLPGTVAVPLFSPAIAVAQVVADLSLMEEDRMDAICEYLAQFGRDPALAVALHRYEIAPTVIDDLMTSVQR